MSIRFIGGGSGGGVTSISPGTGISVNQSTGAVTITNTGSGSTGANPTAVVGTTAVNGVATTFMRSDASAPIDLTFTPSWTGKHTWNMATTANTVSDATQLQTSVAATTGNQQYSPALHMTGSGFATTPVAAQPCDARMYVLPAQGAANPSANLIIDYSINGAAFANMLTMGLVSNGTTTLLGSFTANGVRVQGASIPTNGIYMPTSNQLGFSTNSTLRATIEPGGQIRNVIIGAGYSTAEGSNAKQGTATLAAGTVVVSNTSVTASSRIFLTAQSVGGTAGALAVTARTAGTSFTITSTSGTDTSVVAYEIFEPS